jgi:antitoxin component YwqK of YwqJK toxin-antitoxin module
MQVLPSYLHFNHISLLKKHHFLSLVSCLSFLIGCGGDNNPCPNGTELEGLWPTHLTAQQKKEIDSGELIPKYSGGCYTDTGEGRYRHGLYQSWHEDGKTLKSKYVFEGGVRHGEYVEFYEDGQMKEEGAFEFGLRHGKFTTWYRNGNVHVEGIYKDDKRNGDFAIYSDDEMMISKGPYFLGFKHGKWTNEYLALNGRSTFFKFFYHYGKIAREP